MNRETRHGAQRSVDREASVTPVQSRPTAINLPSSISSVRRPVCAAREKTRIVQYVSGGWNISPTDRPRAARQLSAEWSSNLTRSLYTTQRWTRLCSVYLDSIINVWIAGAFGVKVAEPPSCFFLTPARCRIMHGRISSRIQHRYDLHHDSERTPSAVKIQLSAIFYNSNPAVSK